jgi:hypothetical protein
MVDLDGTASAPSSVATLAGAVTLGGAMLATEEGALAVPSKSTMGLRLRFRLDEVGVKLESAGANSVGSGESSSIASAFPTR